MPKIIELDKLSGYLRNASNVNLFSLIPEGSKNIRVYNLEKMDAGYVNNLYSFNLQFSFDGFDNYCFLVLKGFVKVVDIWYHNELTENSRNYLREFSAMKSLGNIGFTVPKVYFCEVDQSILGYPFMVKCQITQNPWPQHYRNSII